MGEKVLILYSGGSDSRLMLKMAKEQGLNPLCLFVDYGQPWDKSAPYFCRWVSVSGLLLNWTQRYENVAVDYVPNRNMMLVSIAGVIAQQEGISRIWLGANATDIEDRYPDCHPIWIKACSGILPEGIRLEAPHQWLTQEEVKRRIDGNAC